MHGQKNVKKKIGDNIFLAHVWFYLFWLKVKCFMLCLISMTTNCSIYRCVVFPATVAYILSTKHATRLCIIKLGVKKSKTKVHCRGTVLNPFHPLQSPQSIPRTAFYTYIIIYCSVFPVCKGLRSFRSKFFLNFLSLLFELYIYIYIYTYIYETSLTPPFSVLDSAILPQKW